MIKGTFKSLLLLPALLVAIASMGQSDSEQPEPPVFTFVEQAPVFPGGDAGLIRFLQQNVVYPQMERDNDIQGKVVVRFVVMEDGRVDSVNVITSVSPGLDREAVRVVKRLPNFKPGMQQGRNVRVYYNLPIIYKLQENEVQKVLSKQLSAIKEKAASDPDFANAVEQARKENYSLCIKYLGKSIKADKKNPLAYDLKGVVELETGDKKAACKDLKLALEKGSIVANDLLIKNCR